MADSKASSKTQGHTPPNSNEEGDDDIESRFLTGPGLDRGGSPPSVVHPDSSTTISQVSGKASECDQPASASIESKTRVDTMPNYSMATANSPVESRPSTTVTNLPASSIQSVETGSTKYPTLARQFGSHARQNLEPCTSNGSQMSRPQPEAPIGRVRDSLQSQWPPYLPANRIGSSDFGLALGPSSNATDSRVPRLYISPGYGQAAVVSSPAKAAEYRHIPADVRKQLDKWYLDDSRIRPPPCVLTLAEISSLSLSEGEQACTFVHKSGEILKITVGVLPALESLPSNARKYLLIAGGPTLGPFAIGILAERRKSAPQPYHIWQGVDAPDLNGWEAEASIQMLHSRSVHPGKEQVVARESPPQNPQPVRAEDAIRRRPQRPTPPKTVQDPDGDAVSIISDGSSIPAGPVETPPASNPPTLTSTSPKSPDDNDELPGPFAKDHPLPAHLRGIVNEWCYHSGLASPLSNIPFRTTSPDKLLSMTLSGRTVKWTNSSNRPITVRSFLFDPKKPSGGASNAPKLLVAEGAGLGPIIIAFGRTRNEDVSEYKTWVGLSGDKYGFLLGPPQVLKHYGPWPGKGNGKNLGAKWRPTLPLKSQPMLKHQSPQSPRISPPKSAETATSAPADDLGLATGRKRKRELDNLAWTMNHEPVPKQPRIDITPPPAKSAILTRPPLSAIKKHMPNSTAFIFYAPNIPTPRVRLLSACDTVDKLFAQAVAGDCFGDEDEGSGARVLSLRFGDCGLPDKEGKEGRKGMVVVEEDDEDFEALIRAIEARDWWRVGKPGIVEGSGTVEVRSKR